MGIDFWKHHDLLPKSLAIEEVELAGVEASDSSSADTHVLSEDQRKKLSEVINCFPSFTQEGLGKTNLITHSIDVGSAYIKQRHFLVSPAAEKALYTEIDRMLQLGVIEESQSAWSSPIVMVSKPGKVRICLDCRKKNSFTEKDAYPMPQINGILSRPVPNFAALAAPLKDLMTTKRKFSLTPEAIKAFQVLKRCLTEAPVLCNSDFSKPFETHCDASKSGVGAVLVQVSEEGDKRPIAFVSKKLIKAQRNYIYCHGRRVFGSDCCS